MMTDYVNLPYQYDQYNQYNQDCRLNQYQYYADDGEIHFVDTKCHQSLHCNPLENVFPLNVNGATDRGLPTPDRTPENNCLRSPSLNSSSSDETNLDLFEPFQDLEPVIHALTMG